MQPLDRRQFIGTVGGLSAVALAGCTDDSTDDRVDESGVQDDGEGASDDGDESDGAAALVVDQVDAPSWTAVGSPMTLTITVENTGDTAGTFQDAVVDTSQETVLESIEVEVPPGDTVEWESQPIVRQSVPSSGRIEFQSQDHSWSTAIDVVQRLSLGEETSFDQLSVAINAFVLKDSYQYTVGNSQAQQEAPEGKRFLFVYLTVDAIGAATPVGALPRRSAIGVEIDGEFRRAQQPTFPPSREPYIYGDTRRSRISASDIASGLAAYDPDVIEETETVPSDERMLGDRDPIWFGQSSWAMVTVPEEQSLRDLTVLLSR